MKSTDDEAGYRNYPLEKARELLPGSRHYRAYVGSPNSYDIVGATQFMMMSALGLRESHTLLDIGCGSLCGGRLFIPYLNPGCYFGLEPQRWLVEDGMKFELGEDMCRIKSPSFSHDMNFTLTTFGVQFDYMIAHSVMTHASQAQLDRCLQEASRAMKPNGLFAASFVSFNDDVYEGAEWIYPEYASYPVMFVRAAAARHGLSCEPFIWSNSYGHYWMIFFHASRTAKVSWLGELKGEQRLIRIVELMKQVSDTMNRLEETQEKLKIITSEMELLRQTKA